MINKKDIPSIIGLTAFWVFIGVMFYYLNIAEAQQVVGDGAVTIQASPSGAVQAINNFGDKIPASLPLWLVSGLGVLLEILARRIPTAQPMSIFIMVSAIFKGISNIFMKISGLLDQVIGQSTKAP